MLICGHDNVQIHNPQFLNQALEKKIFPYWGYFPFSKNKMRWDWVYNLTVLVYIKFLLWLLLIKSNQAFNSSLRVVL